MEDLFKNFLYTGVGLVAMTAEKIQKSVGKLVSEGKLSLEEGKKVVDKLVNEGKLSTDEGKKVLDDLVKKGKLSAEELVSEYIALLRVPPSWPIDSRGDRSVQYHIADYNFTLEFKEDGWRYHLKIEREGRTAENWGEVPYAKPGVPNMKKLFNENVELGRRELANSE